MSFPVFEVPEMFARSAVPDGHYTGMWHAYLIKFDVNGDEVFARTDDGLRGWSNVEFDIVGGRLASESIKHLREAHR